jgi:hypothetical protein
VKLQARRRRRELNMPSNEKEQTGG